MSGRRPLRLPPPDFRQRVLPVADVGAVVWWRLYWKGAEPAEFVSRAGHRFSAADGGGVLYLGDTLETCALECFGDRIVDGRGFLSWAEWGGRMVCQIEVSGLRVCDLRDPETILACETDYGALHHPDLAVPQAWARAIFEHPAAFDAICYRGRFGGMCLAVTDRGKSGVRLVTPLGSWADQAEALSFVETYGIGLIS